MDYALDNVTMQKLIDHLHANEMQTILQFRYSNPQARANDISQCQQGYQQASALLHAEAEAQAPQQEDKEMMQQFWTIIRSGIRLSYEIIKNLKFRYEFLAKLWFFRHAFFIELDEIVKADEAIREQMNGVTADVPVSILIDDPRYKDDKNAIIKATDTFNEDMIELDKALENLNLVDAPNDFISNTKNYPIINTTVGEPHEFGTPSGTLQQVELNDADELSLPDKTVYFEIQIKEKLKDITKMRINEFYQKFLGVVSPIWDAKTRMVLQSLDHIRIDTELQYLKLPEEMSEREYAQVIKSTFRETALNFSRSLKELDSLGDALLIVAIGIMIWNVGESQNPKLESIKDILSLGVSLAGGTLGAWAGAAAGSIGGPIGVYIGGILGGLISAFLSGIAADSIFDAMLKAWGPSNPSQSAQLLFGGPVLYELQLPDNMTLSQSFISNLGTDMG